MNELPEGWRSMSLRDLLPDTTIKKLVPILNRITVGRDLNQGRLALSKLLAPHEAELLEKGVVKDYLVYYLLHLALQQSEGSDLNDVLLN